MLEEIRIQGLGVIEDAELELDPGLTVVTGETGAGKTMVVTGLSLLLGGRADPGLVRPSVDRAIVEGRVRLDPKSPAAERAQEAGATLEDDTLIIVRTVSREGRSRAFAGGTSVPNSVLGDLAEDLVALHGQNDQIQLLRPARQRLILDRYAGDPVAKPLAIYREKYQRLAAVDAELADLVARARDRAQEADLLRFGLGEIEAVDPQPGEDDELSTESGRLGHADALRRSAEEAHLALVGDEDPSASATDVLTLLASARKSLDGVREHDPQLAALSDRVAEASMLVADAGADLASYAAGVDTDPARLQAVGERRAALAALTRKYGDTVDEVLAWSAKAAERLADLDGSDDRIDTLRSERAAQFAELGELATTISNERQIAAERLGEAVSEELTALAMPHAVLTASVTQTDATDNGLDVDGRQLSYGPHGVDDIELLLTPHRGAPARPVQRGASGGELSRVMLAVEVVFAGTDGVPTFVFDEVDAGVGGKAAVEIGRRLAMLAKAAQVVVVTHLPQVAAFADRHYVVRKADDGSVTRSGLVRLDDQSRVEELARMLAGLEDSASARAHAEELLATAAKSRKKSRRR
ncbi:DNA repair protein RecN [Tenggerimyces flavus]|uniref:DNA repair protein RecN n=1 Tax=Tenggerimyces flavus TaxID=1708749 RepID=A0ABV7YKI3_9ACTN|nr:DNA repair protein RecN [Tenggerimyces flavus]MBM7787454.1 DNA repair protein RecN (Recombination protein N) [Tenggerimyces flavus]